MAGYYAVYNDEYLMHHGVKGMKWGVRKRGKVKGMFGPLSTTKVHYTDGTTGYLHDAVAGTRKHYSHDSGFGETKKEAKVNATVRLASDSYVRGEYLSKRGLAKAEKVITKYYSKHYNDLSSSKHLNKRNKAYVKSLLNRA